MRMKLIVPNKPNHYALWMWLHTHPVKRNGRLTEKKDWPGFRTMKRLKIYIPESYCFACEEVNGLCHKCQFHGMWGCFNGLYRDWALALSPEYRAIYAKRIAERCA